MGNTGQLEYKCRRCGMVHKEGIAHFDLCRTLLIAMTVSKEAVNRVNSGIPHHILGVHHCEDGGMGISDCIGFRIKGRSDDLQ